MRALVQWLWETTQVREVVGSNPGTVYWKDMKNFHIDLLLNCIVCLKRPKINKKRSGLAHFFKKSSQSLLQRSDQNVIKQRQ